MRPGWEVTVKSMTRTLLVMELWSRNELKRTTTVSYNEKGNYVSVKQEPAFIPEAPQIFLNSQESAHVVSWLSYRTPEMVGKESVL